MIDRLVEQIETRSAELEREMSDPAVIGDRERNAELGRQYRELEPARGLARVYRTLATTSRERESCLPRTATTPTCAKSSRRRRRVSPSSRS